MVKHKIILSESLKSMGKVYFSVLQITMSMKNHTQAG